MWYHKYMPAEIRRPARDQTLPPLAVATLRLHQHTDYEELRRFAASLFEDGWTLRAIGEGCDPKVSRFTVRNWVRDAEPDDYNRRAFPATYATPVKYSRITTDPTPVPLKHHIELPLLQGMARKVRSDTPRDSMYRIASDLLDNLIIELLEQGCCVRDIAHISGVTPKSMYARLNRIKKREQEDAHPIRPLPSHGRGPSAT